MCVRVRVRVYVYMCVCVCVCVCVYVCGGYGVHSTMSLSAATYLISRHETHKVAVRLLPTLELDESANDPRRVLVGRGIKDYSSVAGSRLTFRTHGESGRRQLKIDSILNTLSRIRNSKSFSMRKECFCLVGVTMEDLFDSRPDLFVAGFAFGGSKVAVFSFYRYHPRVVDPALACITPKRRFNISA